jgi:hypothetical protein
VAFIIDGDVSSFGSTEQVSLKEALQDEISCHEPACFLALKVSPASIAVSATITIPEEPLSVPSSSNDTNTSTIATAIAAAAATLTEQSTPAISSALGVLVLSVTPVAVKAGVAAPIIVAPPQPSPPMAQLNESGTMSSLEGGEGGATKSTFVLVLVAGCSALLAGIYYCHRRQSGWRRGDKAKTPADSHATSESYSAGDHECTTTTKSAIEYPELEVDIAADTWVTVEVPDGLQVEGSADEAAVVNYATIGDDPGNESEHSQRPPFLEPSPRPSRTGILNVLSREAVHEPVIYDIVGASDEDASPSTSLQSANYATPLGGTDPRTFLIGGDAPIGLTSEELTTLQRLKKRVEQEFGRLTPSASSAQSDVETSGERAARRVQRARDEMSKDLRI